MVRRTEVLQGPDRANGVSLHVACPFGACTSPARLAVVSFRKLGSVPQGGGARRGEHLPALAPRAADLQGESWTLEGVYVPWLPRRPFRCCTGAR